MRKIFLIPLACLMLLPATASAQQPLNLGTGEHFTTAFGYATKTGDRGVIVFAANSVVWPKVEWGCSGADMSRTVLPLGNAPDSAGMFFIEGMKTCSGGGTVHAELVDMISGTRSSHITFSPTNAYTDHYSPSDPYDLDLVIQVDAPAQPEIPGMESVRPDLALTEIAEGVNVMAERLYDATDGYARLRNVLVMDTATDWSANVPFYPTFGCAQRRGNLADFLFQTTIPYDSHTWGGWAIDDACTQISMGRKGQLVLNYSGDLHMGYVMTHELMHYAFNAPDLYDVAGSGGCNDRNSGRDVSLMHNTGGWSAGRWWLTEMDRPFDHSNSGFAGCRGGQDSWSRLRARYGAVPQYDTPNPGPGSATVARGNPDGGALNIFMLSRSVSGASTLVDVDESALDNGPPGPIRIL